MKKPLHERIAATEERKAQLLARLAVMKGKQKAADRKLVTRRKIVVGAAVLVEMERDPKFSAYVRKMLAKAVTRPQDRETVADLIQVGAEAMSPPSNANTPLNPSDTAKASFPVTVREKVAG